MNNVNVTLSGGELGRHETACQYGWRLLAAAAVLLTIASCRNEPSAEIPAALNSCSLDVVPSDLLPYPSRVITRAQSERMGPDQGIEADGITVDPVSGDAFAAIVAIQTKDGDESYADMRVRLAGIEAPQSPPWSDYARECLSMLTTLDKVRIETDDQPYDQWGNTWAYLITQHGVANVQMVERGWARAALLTGNGYYDTAISDAESRAKARKVGMWGPAPPPLSTDGRTR